MNGERVARPGVGTRSPIAREGHQADARRAPGNHKPFS